MRGWGGHAGRPYKRVTGLDLHALPADAVRFIPVQLSLPDAAGCQLHGGNAFHFPPAPRSALLLQASNVPDCLPDGNGLNMGYLPNDGKGHA